MSKKYEHLFFDLDHTLWDFEANSKTTLTEMYGRYNMEQATGADAEQFYNTYIHINREKWQLYSLGKITKDELRAQRFPDTFKTFGYEDTDFLKNFEEEYIATCPHKTQLMPGTIELLDYLQGKYELHVITNGFMESQDTKMNKSGISPYFKNVFSSELFGVNKPGALIFHESLKRARAGLHHSLMIGDNLQADIIGAKAVGMDQVYYNPEEEEHDESPTYEVSHLLQLKSFL
jgi:putative hydrolase of the HAD superfamily